jgi:hypothetical protein
MDNPSTPLKVNQFKPAIQAKTIVDEIFNSINYKYTSSFFNSTLFKNLYILSTADDNDGISFASSTSGSYVYSTSSITLNSNLFTSLTTTMSFQAEVYDSGNNWSTNTYTADFTGLHNITLQIPYTIGYIAGSPNPNRTDRQFWIWSKVNGVRVGNKIVAPLKKGLSGKINTGIQPVQMTQGDTLQIEIYYVVNDLFETITTNVTDGLNGVYLKIDTPTNPVGGTVNIGNCFGDTKILDFMKGLIHKFNLIMEPSQDNPNIIRVEPYIDWINQGRVKDWTGIVDRNIKFQIEHPAQRLPKTFTFTDRLDEDWLNQDYNTTYDKTYGTYVYNSNSDLPSGEEIIGDFFGATPVKQLPVNGDTGTTVVPWLVKKPEGGKNAKPYQFEIRLLHKTPKKTIPNNEMFGTYTGSLSGVPSGSTFYYVDDPTNSAIRTLNQYRTLLPTTDSPTDFTASLDLHYSNLGYYPYQQSSVNGQCRDGLYNRYWSYYINSLYDVDARLLTCNILLEPSIIKDIKLNDKIFIDGHYYRINKISGANLINPKSTEVQLIKLLSGVQGYTGKRRISTGLNPEDFVDVITGDITTNGKVIYNNANTGVPITASNVLDQLGTLDGFTVLDNEVVWNDKQPIDVYNNVISVGINKIPYSVQNSIFIGSGNDIGSNTLNGFIFGNNNNLLDAANNVVMFAQTSSIIESNDVYLLQPTGTRIVSGSSNNVVINPINDILPSDPTGAVYTGNLINQGTADMKNGMSATGSVDITGSLFVNGREIESPRYISVYSDQTQTLASDLAETPMTFSFIDINYGFDISGSSGFVIQKAGRYNIQFSAQVYNNGSGNHNAYIWLRKNDGNVAQTNGKVRLKGNNDAYVAVWNYVVNAEPNDKYELYWSADDTTIELLAQPAPVGGQIPSTIITIDQLS